MTADQHTMEIVQHNHDLVAAQYREPAEPRRLVRRSVRATGRGGWLTGVYSAAGCWRVVTWWWLWVAQPEAGVQVKATRSQVKAIEGQVKDVDRQVRSGQRGRRKNRLSEQALAELQSQLSVLQMQAEGQAGQYKAQARDLHRSQVKRLVSSLVILGGVVAGGGRLAASGLGWSLTAVYEAASAVAFMVLVVVGALVTDRTPVRVEESGETWADQSAEPVDQQREIEAGDPYPLAGACNAYEVQICIQRALTAVGVDWRGIEEDIRRLPWGWQVSVLLRSGEPSDITDNLRKLEVILGLGPGQLHVQPDPGYAPRVFLRCVLRDPFADMPPIPIAAPNSLSITNTLVTAMRMDAQYTGLDLEGGHTIVIARTRAGKTVLVRRVAERVLACVDAVLVDIDTSGAGGLDCYGDAIALKARTDAEALELLRLLVAIAKVRPMIRASLGMDDESWEVSTRYPAIVVNIDEFPLLPKACKALVLELQQIGAKARVMLVIESQKGTKAALGAAMADAFANRIMLACEHDDVVQVLGSGMLAQGWRPDRLRPAIGKKPFDAGIFYVLGGDNDAPVQSKVERIVPAQARQIGRERAGSRPQIDSESLAAARKLLDEGQELVSGAALGATLAADMVAALGDQDRQESDAMLAALRRLDPDEYGDLTQEALTRRLRPLGLADRKSWRREDGSWVRGYTRDLLEGA